MHSHHPYVLSRGLNPDIMANQLVRRSMTTATNKTSNEPTFSSLFPLSSGLNGVQLATNDIYVNVLLLLFLALFAFTLFLRWAKMFIAHLRHISIMGNPLRQIFWTTNSTTWWPLLKRHLLYAPLWKHRHNKEMSISKVVNMGTLPGRGHFLFCMSYTLVQIGWTLGLPYNEPRDDVVAALRGRSGVIALFNLFPTIVFALRNNPFIWVLQVPYDTFNLYHRWSARIFTVEAIIHFACWISNTETKGGWSGVNMGLTQGPHAPSYDWGLVALICAFFIVIQAWSPLRHAFYETFLFLHKVLVLLTFIGIFMHLNIDKLPQMFWMIIIALIWAGEYVCRFYRIVRYNVNRNQWSSKVTIQALPGEACRVTFYLANYWKPKAGTHMHAYLPALAPFQSHPFSVAWADVTELPPSPQYNAKGVELPFSSKDMTENLDYVPDRKTAVSLIVRARTGFTRDLYNRANNAPNKTIHTWGFAEGFYGGGDSLNSYGDVLLFAAGVGITHQIMFTKELLEGYRNGTVAMRKITLVWTVPTTECLEWVRDWMDVILAMPCRRECLQIYLYITHPRSRKEIKSGTGSVKMLPGRCYPQQVLDREVLDRRGAMVTTVCGPGAFADTVRDAVRRRVEHGVLDFVEEAFSY